MEYENTEPNAPPMVSFSLEQEVSIEEVDAFQKYLETDSDLHNNDKKPGTETVTIKDTPSNEVTILAEPLPVPIARNYVSGLYSVNTGVWRLDLRIDVDRRRPMMKASGDFYSISGGTIIYFGSFRIDSISLSTSQNLVTIRGNATTTWNSSYKVARIDIPRTPLIRPPGPATLRWFNDHGQAGAVYACTFESIYFRRVLHEMDFEQGVTPFVSYNTGSLPSGGPARTLSITSAYNEAGIDFPQIAGNSISSSETLGGTWSDRELHASMERHFSLYRDQPQWTVWSVACKSQHDIGSGLLGIMFDQEGRERQGCAVFYGGVGGNSADKLRLQLYTHVHELGHCFNLLHSWQKSYASPPAPNRPLSMSWMNYPWAYQGGREVFWSGFPFQFDDLEIIHLRHAYRDNIILGGNPFITGSALDSQMANIRSFQNPIQDNSGLELRLESEKPNFRFGEPVVTVLKLTTKVKQGKKVHTQLHPKYGFVKIGILKPSGVFNSYEPLMDYLLIPNTAILTEENPSIYESAYIGYGKNLYFDQIGEYLVRAVYYSLDGSQVFSNVLSINVNPPVNESDQRVGELLMGDQQGKLLYLLGSLSPTLSEGNKAFDKVLNEYPDHPLAAYVKFVRGISEGKGFKVIEEDKVSEIQEPHPDKSIALLNQAVEESRKEEGLDNISLNYAMRQLAKQHALKNDIETAKQVMNDMVSLFSSKNLNSNVIDIIKKQASNTLESLEANNEKLGKRNKKE